MPKIFFIILGIFIQNMLFVSMPQPVSGFSVNVLGAKQLLNEKAKSTRDEMPLQDLLGLTKDVFEKIIRLIYVVLTGLAVIAFILLGKNFSIWTYEKKLKKMTDEFSVKLEALEKQVGGRITSVEDIVCLISNAVILVHEGEIDDAIGNLLQVIEKDPKNFSAFLLLGFCYHRKGMYDQAIEVLQGVLKQQPHLLRARERLGYAYNRKNMTKDAVNCFMEVLAKESQNVRVMRNLSYSYNACGDYQSAKYWANRALAISPFYPKALNNKGYALLKLGEYPDAMKCFMQAIELDPNYIFAHYNLARWYSMNGKFEDALRALCHAVKYGFSDYQYLEKDHDFDDINQSEYGQQFREIVRGLNKEHD